MPRASVPLFENPEGRALVEKLCRERGVPEAILHELLAAVIQRAWMQRAAGLWPEFDDLLDAIALRDSTDQGVPGDVSTPS